MNHRHQEQPWQNDLDTKKYLTEVHSDFKQYLGVDFKLAKLTDKQKEFIMDMLTIGMMSSDLTPNPDVGEEIKMMDYATINAISILEFNNQENMIIDRLTDYGKREEEKKQEEEKEDQWFNKMKKRMMKAKNDDE